MDRYAAAALTILSTLAIIQKRTMRIHLQRDQINTPESIGGIAGEVQFGDAEELRCCVLYDQVCKPHSGRRTFTQNQPALLIDEHTQSYTVSLQNSRFEFEKNNSESHFFKRHTIPRFWIAEIQVH